MSSEWKTVTFADAPFAIIDGDRGANYPKQHEFSSAGHCLFLNAGNVTQNGFSFSDCAFVTPEKDAALRKGKLVRHDLVLTTRGTVGNVAYFSDAVKYQNIRINSGMVIFRPDATQILPYYLYLFLRSSSFREQVAYLTSGSAQPQLPIRDMNRIEMPLPPLPIQQEICAVLGSLDDRIALLRETNATLEAIAQALFKSWFVDFDPVHARARGEQPEGLPEPLAALFPDSFEESPLGLLPRGWRVGCVGDFAQQKKGSVNPLASPETVFEHYSLPAFDNGQAPVMEAGAEIKSNKTPLPAEAVLLSKLNPHIPRVWLPVKHGANAVCSTEFLAFGPAGGSSKEFVYCFFSSPDFLQHLCQLVTGTSNSHQRVKPDQVSSTACVVPPPAILAAFADVARPMFEGVYENRQQAQTLATLRDTLLPRLISGQLRLPEAEF